MLKDLNHDEQRLANYMSELSEIAYSASWMKNLEIKLWELKNGKILSQGRLNASEEIINNLNKMSLKINGWIFYDDTNEESFISMEQWKFKLKNYNV